MSRIARIVAPGYPHHITHRGNNRQDVFFVDDDRHAYLEILKDNCAKYGLDILAYCLMTNHIHLIAVPENEESLAKAVGTADFRYTQYINRMHKRTGHLWEGRFYSCALDNRGFWLASKYVELNPLRAKICRIPWRYKWSSAAAHSGENDRHELLDLKKWNRMVTVKEWQKELLRGLDLEQISKLRLSTHTGRPLGTDSFMSKLEKLIGRRVRALPHGRPKKHKK
ncbi:MAG: transposase [Sedimentisphaerales bacterium]|nr:transposase [Sedimentisphaerales bacterium]